MVMHRIDDGFSTRILLALDTSIALWLQEKTVKPSGFDYGGRIDTTTMRNTTERTAAPKKLRTMTAMTGTCAYDPAVLPRIQAIGGRIQLVTVNYPDGSTWSFHGWLDKFEPNELREGEQPTASYTIEASNYNPTTGAETSGSYVTGTTSTTTTTTTTTP